MIILTGEEDNFLEDFQDQKRLLNHHPGPVAAEEAAHESPRATRSRDETHSRVQVEVHLLFKDGVGTLVLPPESQCRGDHGLLVERAPGVLADLGPKRRIVALDRLDSLGGNAILGLFSGHFLGRFSGWILPH